VIPDATDTVEKMLSETNAKEVQKIPFVGNTMRRRIPDISEDFYDQSLGQLRTCFALPADEATGVLKMNV
jgi:hypothetical protein